MNEEKPKWDVTVINKAYIKCLTVRSKAKGDKINRKLAG